jgi:hypothetical protein
MAVSHPLERTELRGRAATVTIDYHAPDRAFFSVWTDGRVGAAFEAARLACEAVHQARVRDTRRLEVMLEVATPACGVILEALRRRRGNDLDGIELRRAGASVMVTLDVRPWPVLRRTPIDHGALLPTQPTGSAPPVRGPVIGTPATR